MLVTLVAEPARWVTALHIFLNQAAMPMRLVLNPAQSSTALLNDIVARVTWSRSGAMASDFSLVSRCCIDQPWKVAML